MKRKLGRKKLLRQLRRQTKQLERLAQGRAEAGIELRAEPPGRPVKHIDLTGKMPSRAYRW